MAKWIALIMIIAGVALVRSACRADAGVHGGSIILKGIGGMLLMAWGSITMVVLIFLAI